MSWDKDNLDFQAVCHERSSSRSVFTVEECLWILGRAKSVKGPYLSTLFILEFPCGMTYQLCLSDFELQHPEMVAERIRRCLYEMQAQIVIAAERILKDG